MTTSSSNQADSHVVPLLICETCNEIHIYIYEYISTYRPTFFLNSTRESKDQIGVALAMQLISYTTESKVLSTEFDNTQMKLDRQFSLVLVDEA